MINFMMESMLLLLPDETDDVCYSMEHADLYDYSVAVCTVVAVFMIIAGCATWAALLYMSRTTMRAVADMLLRCAPDEDALNTGSPLAGSAYKVYVSGVSLWAKGQEQPLLDEVCCSFEAGKLTGVMGQSGCGKTLLLDTISCQDMNVRAKGVIYDTSSTGREGLRSVAYSKVDPLTTLFETLTVCENLIAASLMRYPGDVSLTSMCSDSVDGASREHRETLRMLIRTMHLEGCLNTKVKHLSEGEKRRLSIAIECLRPSRVLLLDEPTTGLDSQNALEVVRLLSRLAEELSKAVVLVIHQPSREVFNELHDLILMQEGRCIYSGGRGAAVSELVPDFDEKEASNPAELLLLNMLKRRASAAEGRTDSESTDSTGQEHHQLPAIDVRFWNRFLGCLLTQGLASSWDFCITISMLLFFSWFISIGLADNPTAPTEAIALLSIVISCTTIGYVSAMYGRLGAASYRFCHLHSSRVLSGFDFYLSHVLWHLCINTCCSVVVITAIMYIALDEYMDWKLLLQSNALAMAASWYTVCLILTTFVAAANQRYNQLQHYEKLTLYFTGYTVYTAVGWVVSGTYYRIDELAFKQLYYAFTYTSVAYWGSFSLLITFFNERVFHTCNTVLPEYTGYDPSCHGQTYLQYYHADEHPLLPGAGAPMLCAGALLAAAAGFIICSRHKGTNLIK